MQMHHTENTQSVVIKPVNYGIREAVHADFAGLTIELSAHLRSCLDHRDGSFGSRAESLAQFIIDVTVIQRGFFQLSQRFAKPDDFRADLAARCSASLRRT